MPLEYLECETEMVGRNLVLRHRDFDNLWLALFPLLQNLCCLIWNIPIGYLKRSPIYVVSGLFRLSIVCREVFRGSVGFTFTQLHSLSLTVEESIKFLWNISGKSFPAMTLLSIAFLGPNTDLQLVESPSLIEPTISTRLPTFTQGTKICALLLHEPQKCPRLEQLALDGFLEWDILHLLLRRRNVLRNGPISRIKRLNLYFIPSKILRIFESLLGGRDILPLSIFLGLEKLSIQEGESRLLDLERFFVSALRCTLANMTYRIGCFACVYIGLESCNIVLQPSKLPNKGCTSDMKERAFTEIIGPRGIFSLHNWDMQQPINPKHLTYEAQTMSRHRERAERRRNRAYEWPKRHYGETICHKVQSSQTVTITESER